LTRPESGYGSLQGLADMNEGAAPAQGNSSPFFPSCDDPAVFRLQRVDVEWIIDYQQ
jgi:hypothetical protein